MKLREYVDQLQQISKRPRMLLYADIAVAAKVSEGLVRAAARGQRVGQYDKAKAISQACHGLVSIPELCDE